jgi:hypothetical protein
MTARFVQRLHCYEFRNRSSWISELHLTSNCRIPTTRISEFHLIAWYMQQLHCFESWNLSIRSCHYFDLSFLDYSWQWFHYYFRLMKFDISRPRSLGFFWPHGACSNCIAMTFEIGPFDFLIPIDCDFRNMTTIKDS